MMIAMDEDSDDLLAVDAVWIDGVMVPVAATPEGVDILLGDRILRVTASEAHELGTLLRRMARKVREEHEAALAETLAVDGQVVGTDDAR